MHLSILQHVLSSSGLGCRPDVFPDSLTGQLDGAAFLIKIRKEKKRRNNWCGMHPSILQHGLSTSGSGRRADVFLDSLTGQLDGAVFLIKIR
jgi:hypothetical protein